MPRCISNFRARKVIPQLAPFDNAMNIAKLTIDPLWQCLCPAWTPARLIRTSRGIATRNARKPVTSKRFLSSTFHRPLEHARSSPDHNDQIYNPLKDLQVPEQPSTGWGNPTVKHVQKEQRRRHGEEENVVDPQWMYETQETGLLYGRLRIAAAKGETKRCRSLAEYLVKERRERPSLQIYEALILSNVHHEHGAAWRVAELLEEMKEEGLQPDAGTCHSVLKVLSVHLDHLLRTDILEYMQKRWYQLSEDGAHDVVAGLFREALFEQALDRLDRMRRDGMQVEPWLYNMAVFMLCNAGEIEEAFRIMRMRFDEGDVTLHRSLWTYLLDKGSDYRHHRATSLAWNSQVSRGYLNPSSGVCLNVLATASQAGDAALATEVFSHLSKRGTAFQPIHYELLISAYLCADPPDVQRAVSILTIMPLEKLEPTVAQTRSLFHYLRDKPAQVKEALVTLRDLHDQRRKISIAALNLLIECYVEQENLPEAIKIYKLIHTFAPMNKGAQKSFANIDTFNLLLKGCRTTDPPDEQQASFLVSELLALRVVPTALTYDRLILVFVLAGKRAIENAAQLETDEPEKAAAERAKGLELLDWSWRHFTDMQPLGWMPRFGTLERIAIELANVNDDRCWDVLQVAEDEGSKVEGYEHKGKWTRAKVEKAWQEAIRRDTKGEKEDALDAGLPAGLASESSGSG